MKRHNINIDTLIDIYILQEWKNSFLQQKDYAVEITASPWSWANKHYLFVCFKNSRIDFDIEYYLPYYDRDEFVDDIKKIEVALLSLGIKVINKIDYSKDVCGKCYVYDKKELLLLYRNEYGDEEYYCSRCVEIKNKNRLYEEACRLEEKKQLERLKEVKNRELLRSKKSVYLFKANDCYKIGIASSIEKRIAALQTGNPYKVACIFHAYHPNAHSIESSLHMVFKHKKAHGEWFLLNEEDIEFCKNTILNSEASAVIR